MLPCCIYNQYDSSWGHSHKSATLVFVQTSAKKMLAAKAAESGFLPQILNQFHFKLHWASTPRFWITAPSSSVLGRMGGLAPCSVHEFCFLVPLGAKALNSCYRLALHACRGLSSLQPPPNLKILAKSAASSTVSTSTDANAASGSC